MQTPAITTRFAREDFEALREALREISRRDPDGPGLTDPAGELGPSDISAEPRGAANVVDFGLERRKRYKQGL